MASFCILFPAFCDGLREPDPAFYREWQALEALGIPWRVVNVEALVSGDLVKALRFFGENPEEPIIYRGWILHPGEISVLLEALAARGCRTLISVQEYCNALLFPRFFPRIADHSFPAVWIDGTDPGQALAAARPLGPPPYFIKDHAKSAKEIWPDGCVVATRGEMAPAIRALRKFRGEQFKGGVVIRPLMKLRYLGESPFGRDVYEEYRLIFFHGTLISQSAYDRIEGRTAALPDYSFLPSRIGSPFFSADIAVTAEGRPYVLEIGDGGTSVLPPGVSPLAFYSAMLNAAAG
jgi:hypothetical protein